MAKVIFEFDSVEDRDDIEMALNGYKFRMILNEINNELRNDLKHNPKDYSEEKLTPFDTIAVKIVLQSTNSSAIPKVKDLRIIACA